MSFRHDWVLFLLVIQLLFWIFLYFKKDSQRSALSKTNDEVYRRELRQFESSVYAESKIDRSKIRLQRLKFVNNVEVKKNIVDQSLGLIDIDFII